MGVAVLPGTEVGAVVGIDVGIFGLAVGAVVGLGVTVGILAVMVICIGVEEIIGLGETVEVTIS